MSLWFAVHVTMDHGLTFLASLDYSVTILSLDSAKVF